MNTALRASGCQPSKPPIARMDVRTMHGRGQNAMTGGPRVPARCNATLSAAIAIALTGTAVFFAVPAVAETFTADSAPEKIVAILGDAAASYDAGQASCRDVRVTGHFEPENLKFSLTIQGAKHRWDEQVINLKNEKVDIFSLNDGKNYFLLNDGYLGIESIKDFDQKWRDSAHGFYDFQMPMVDEGRQTVSEFCRWLIEGIGSTGRFSGEHPFQEKGILRVSEGDSLVIQFRDEKLVRETGGLFFKVTLNAAMNHVMTSFFYAEHSPDSAVYHYERETTSTYREVAPSIFALLRGTTSIREYGSAADETGRAGSRQIGVQIDEFEFGDFPVAPESFDIHSLPIGVGVRVHDERTDPAVDYTYATGPFDEQVLDAAASVSREPNPAGHWRTYRLVGIFAINAILVCGIIWAARRYPRRPRPSALPMFVAPLVISSAAVVPTASAADFAADSGRAVSQSSRRAFIADPSLKLYWSQDSCCGIAAAHLALRYCGKSAALEHVCEHLPISQRGTSMAELQDFLTSQGAGVVSVELRAADLLAILQTHPSWCAIAHVDGGHWVAVLAGNESSLRYFDYPNWRIVDSHLFDRSFGGTALLIGDSVTPVSTFAEVWMERMCYVLALAFATVWGGAQLAVVRSVGKESLPSRTADVGRDCTGSRSEANFDST